MIDGNTFPEIWHAIVTLNVGRFLMLVVPLLVAGGFLVLVAFGAWRWRRPRPTKGEHVRGSRLKEIGLLRRLFTRRRGESLVIGGVRVPREHEALHLLITGATGAGKSQTIQGMLDTLRARQDRAILTDIGADALCRFFREGDVLLNPLDQRSVAWSPFAEIEGAWDTDRVAKSMIPDTLSATEREWFLYSQTLVSAVLKRLLEKGDATNEALLRALTLAAPSELKALVQGLPAQALFHEGAERMLASVRGIVGSYLAPYHYLSKDAGPHSFSIRRHVREGASWLWLPYREDQAAALKPLLAAWLGEAVNAVLSLTPDRTRRHFLLLDEVASLGRVQGLSEALTKGRKYGLCAMVGLQSIAQLRDAYGNDGAQTLLSCLSSQLILRANDPETAEYASLHLGESEVMRASTARGKAGRTTTQQPLVERAVMASEIQALPDRVGYLRLAGQEDVARVQIPLITREPRMEAFVPSAARIDTVPAAPSTSARRALIDAEAILRAGRGE